MTASLGSLGLYHFWIPRDLCSGRFIICNILGKFVLETGYPCCLLSELSTLVSATKLCAHSYDLPGAFRTPHSFLHGLCIFLKGAHTGAWLKSLDLFVFLLSSPSFPFLPLFLPFLLFSLSLYSSSIKSLAVQARLKLFMYLRLTLNPWPSWFHPLSTMITGFYHHTQPGSSILLPRWPI